MEISPYIKGLMQKAQKLNKTIVLPEGEDERVLAAAYEAAKSHLCRLIILGDEVEITAHFAKNNWSMDGIELINPKTSAKLQDYATLLYTLRKDKGMTEEEALKTAQNANYFGTLMVKAGDADGMVSGANHSTADTVRPALQIIKSAKKERVVSALFIAVAQNGQVYYLSDCAVNINPTSKELVDIAFSTAESAIQFGDEARVAMLSYSSYGSGKGEGADKVREATALAKEALKAEPMNIQLDGELQVDAALDAVVAKKKAPGSVLEGNANVLIFPNIEAGNIAYKLLQRLGGAEMYGPMLQGLNAPINDLSRGCFVADIVGVIAITILQTQK